MASQLVKQAAHMGVEKSHVGRASTIPADQNKYSKPEFNGIRLVANPHQGDADVGMFLPINFGPSFHELGPFSDVPHSAFFDVMRYGGNSSSKVRAACISAVAKPLVNRS